MILTLHKDGLLFGTRSDPIFLRVKPWINTQFDMTDWVRSEKTDGVRYPGLGLESVVGSYQVEKRMNRTKGEQNNGGFY